MFASPRPHTAADDAKLGLLAVTVCQVLWGDKC
jgi:hypothetical protein